MTKLSVPQDGASSACSCSGRRGGKTQMFHFSSGIDHAIEMCTIKNEASVGTQNLSVFSVDTVPEILLHFNSVRRKQSHAYVLSAIKVN